MAANTVKLNFINRSEDVNNSDIVIFSKNVDANLDEIAIAWRVIKNCGRNDNHPFTFPMENTISVVDSIGHRTPQVSANLGQVFSLSDDMAGWNLKLEGDAKNPKEIVVKNDLEKGSATVDVFKDGKLFATEKDVVPAQEAIFEFKRPVIYMAVASQAEEGETMSSAVVSENNTEIDLTGIASADIVMSGGGVGPEATAFTFKLENIT